MAWLILRVCETAHHSRGGSWGLEQATSLQGSEREKEKEGSQYSFHGHAPLSDINPLLDTFAPGSTSSLQCQKLEIDLLTHTVGDQLSRPQPLASVHGALKTGVES